MGLVLKCDKCDVTVDPTDYNNLGGWVGNLPRGFGKGKESGHLLIDREADISEYTAIFCPKCSGQEEKKQELLEKAASKPVRRLLQMDAFSIDTGMGGATITDLFPGGYQIFAGKTDELRTGDNDLAVRVHISPTAKLEEALFLLGKIRDYLKRDYAELWGRLF